MWIHRGRTVDGCIEGRHIGGGMYRGEAIGRGLYKRVIRNHMNLISGKVTVILSRKMVQCCWQDKVSPIICEILKSF